MKLTKERLVKIALGALVVIGLGLYFLLYKPLMNKLSFARAQWRTIESELRYAQDSVSSLKFKPVMKEVIPEDDISQAIDALTRDGRSKDVSFVSITPRQIEASQNPTYRVCPLYMEIESTYEQFGEFLGLLDESGKNVVLLKNFNMVSMGGDSAKLRTKLTLNMYISD